MCINIRSKLLIIILVINGTRLFGPRDTCRYLPKLLHEEILYEKSIRTTTVSIICLTFIYKSRYILCQLSPEQY